MKKRLLRFAMLLGLCTLSVPMMGAGNDCPPACIVKDAACALTCGGALNGLCKVIPGTSPQELDCEQPG